MKIGIVVNPKIGSKCDKVLSQFKSLLAENKIEYFNFDNCNENPDILAVFGGDGTVLSYAEYATKNQIPILAINVGTVGYLSSYESNNIENCVNALVNGSYKIANKRMLKVNLSHNDEFLALNDAVVERGRFVDDIRVIAKLGLNIDDNSVYEMYGDGLIIATPTGSTAYSLSAGGVLLTPDLDSFIATPICAHSLNARPIVYRDDKQVKIEILNSSCDCILCIDGKCVKTLKRGDVVTIKKNDNCLKIIDSCENFYKKLIKKIR